MFESVAVPFRSRQGSNRQYLTPRQICEDRELEAFVKRFAHCFERVWYLDIFEFYPDGDAPNGIKVD